MLTYREVSLTRIELQEVFYEQSGRECIACNFEVILTDNICKSMLYLKVFLAFSKWHSTHSKRNDETIVSGGHLKKVKNNGNF